MIVKKEKCSLLCPARHFSATPSEGATSEDPWSRIDGASSSVRIVGAHVGEPNSCERYVRSKLDRLKDLWSTVTDLARIDQRAALSIVRFSCQMKLLFVLTVHPPEITSRTAAAYDDAVVECVSSILGFRPRPQLVTSSLGLGLFHLSSMAPILYERFLHPPPPPDESMGPVSAVADPVAESRTAADAAVLNAFPNMKVRLVALAAAARGSTGWLSSFDSHGLHASRHDVTTLAKLLLLADDIITTPCDCGQRDTGDGSFATHVLTCSRLKGATRTLRHNIIMCALAHNLRRFGCLISIEPTFYAYADGTKKRPDISVLGAPGVCTDLVVSVDPTSALQEKVAKHREAIHTFGHDFIPIAISIWGELDKSVDSFLSKAYSHLSGRLHILAILQTKRSMSEAWLIGTCAMLTGVSSRAYIQDVDELGYGAAAPF